LSVASILPYI